MARLTPKKPLDLRHKYPGASDEALELLTMMLRFDPSERVTVDQALEHPYLSSCRKREREVKNDPSYMHAVVRRSISAGGRGWGRSTSGFCRTRLAIPREILAGKGRGRVQGRRTREG